MSDNPKPVKKVTVGAGVEVVNSTAFECSQCGFKTQKQQEMFDHERDVLHTIASGNYPCGRCKKQVTIVPDYIDKPGKESGLPENNHDDLVKKFTMVTKKPSTASARGGSVYCEDCKKIIIKEISQ